MLKISEVGSTSASVFLKLEGQLAGPWVAETRKSCAAGWAKNLAVQLNMAEVTFADQHGVAALADLRRRGVKLVECSDFLAAQLKAAARPGA
ncbi:MAG TPA: hypothetical protein VHB20_02325 [Verrucomicrobiae bacterium]|jgi:ABC-type transporter Mla MlaB component|nr:hypothetical protein [Verrucomicrobiae bacterium]